MSQRHTNIVSTTACKIPTLVYDCEWAVSSGDGASCNPFICIFVSHMWVCVCKYMRESHLHFPAFCGGIRNF